MLHQQSMRRTSRAQSASRPTIGLLIKWLIGLHELDWLGVADAARAHNANLLCFTGCDLDDPYNYHYQANAIYDLVGPENVDGLIIWSGSLQSHAGEQKTEAFCRRFHPLPIVSVEQVLAGVPSVHADERQGMRAAVDHLIEVHGYRQIAFIRGPETHTGAQDRYQGYLESLARHGLPLDPTLVAPPLQSCWLPTEAAVLAGQLLDRRPGEIEAIVAANDDLAVGAISTLQARNLRVPRDVAVVGFDNVINIGRPDFGAGGNAVGDGANVNTTTLPLTTVQAPFYEKGWRAAELLLAQIRGEAVAELVTIPTELIVRRSCGCFSPAVRHVPPVPPVIAKAARDAGRPGMALSPAQREELVSQLMQALAVPAAGGTDWADQLIAGFLSDLQGRSTDAFLSTLDELVRASVPSDESLAGWWRVLHTLRRQILPDLAASPFLSQAELLWHRTLVFMQEVTAQISMHQQRLSEKRAQILREIGQLLITTFDTRELAEILGQELSTLGMPSCYLALYAPQSSNGAPALLGEETASTQPRTPSVSSFSSPLGGAEGAVGASAELRLSSPRYPTEWSQSILVYEHKQQLNLDGGARMFPSRQLVPGARLRREQPYSIVVEPLYFKEQQLGFALFEAGPREGWVYDALRGQLSSALQGALLVQREERARTEVEESKRKVEAALEEVLVAQARTNKLATELATVAEVSTAAATLLEITNLLQTVVNLTQARFGLAHVHLYLLDSSGDTLALVAGASDVDRQLVAEGWSIPLAHRHSLVAHAARTRQGGMVNNVQANARWEPNPRLSDTRAELAVPLVVGGQVLGVLDVHADVVERFTADDLRIQSTLAAQVAVAIQNARLYHEAADARQAAEEANELKTKFLANMSHELRTPLNAIINFTRIVMAGMRGPVNEGQRDYLERVRVSGEHLLGLINDILDLAKIESGRMELFPEPLLIGELVRSVLATVAGLIKDKPIELTHEIAPNLPMLEADRTRVRQVLLNLLSNAAKFTDAGTITVRAYVDERPNGRIAIHPGDDQRAAVSDAGGFVLDGEDGALVVGRWSFVVLEVQDTGIGIAPEHLATVFEEFHQVAAGNRRYEGTGLGLAICKRLVEMHGGRMWVESSPGVGSTFAFSLPLAPASVPSADEPPARLLSADRTGIPILVIDDDPEAIEVAATYLERDGYTVYRLTDSRHVLTSVREIQPAALILDVLMPYKDGWEVLAELKAAPDLRMLPVVLYTITEEQKLGFALGASAYLVKPVSEKQLRSTVGRLVARHSQILVIDDDSQACEIVAHQLQQGGDYRVITAASAQEGLDHIAADAPDLIILDLMMPRVDGFAVLAQLEREPRTRAIPVVVLTAKELSGAEQQVLQQRVRGLLMKGATRPEQLLEQVKGVLEPGRGAT